MMEHTVPLAILLFFSSLSMNIILQLGLGLKAIALDNTIGRKELLAGSGIFFCTIMFLWVIFSFGRFVFFLGFLEYVLVFPVSALVFSFLAYVVNRFILKESIVFSNLFAAGVVSAALFMVLNVASDLLEAAVLSAGFTIGIVLAIMIAAEIRRRSGMEAVPKWLRGGPLALIAMGLLSLVFSSGAVMLFEVLGAR